MRASLLCVSLVIAQVTSLEPRRWCTRCHVHSTAAMVPVLGQTTHHWVDRHDRAAVCIRSQPQRLVGAAPRLKLHMKLGAQVQVQTALRQTQQSIFAAAVARARACYASSLRALNSFWWPRRSAIADKLFSKSTMDAWSMGISGDATIIPGIFWGITFIVVAALKLHLQKQICNWHLIWLIMSSSIALWLNAYHRLFWSVIRQRIIQEELRKFEERGGWEEGFNQCLFCVGRFFFTPNLGWALEALNQY